MIRKCMLPAFAASALLLGAKTPEVKWEMLPVDSSSPRTIQRFTITGADSVARICFNQLPRPMRAVTPGDSVIEINAGYYALTSPRFSDGKTVVIDVEPEWALRGASEAPEGFHAVGHDGKVSPVAYSLMPMLDAASLNPKWQKWTISPDSIYRLNAKLAQGAKPGPFDIVPSFKKVTVKKGSYKAGSKTETKLISHPNPEYYKITLSPKGAVIEGASRKAIDMAARILDRQLLQPNGGTLPCVVIEDWPDYPYRGVMIDIARNFQTPADMKRLVSLLADYRLNRLHFHITDDEGWRLEIPGLPELTRVGARRGYTLDDEHFLTQIFSGDGNPDSKEGTANGYFTREEFIDFIKFCGDLGIEVIPEIESPGHARAAIKAMEARLRETGDDTYRLIIPGDTSRYTSAQLYHDNLMNPAAPGTYHFIAKVVDEIAAMYRDAGVTLPGIHLGGDEVPEGAWDGSPEAMLLAKERGVNGRHGLQGEYVRKVAAMMRERGIPLYGWQDICTGYDNEFNAEVAPAVGGVNCWVSSLKPEKNVAIQGVKNGYPVILSNVNYFYLDMLYAPHPEERGLYWGGFVDELQSLSGYPDTLCPPQPGATGKIIGVQGQLFAETIRSRQMTENLIFPKVAGLAERGWNGTPTYSKEDFNMLIGQKELPRLHKQGVAFHMRQPGIIIENATVLINSPYPDAEIRYTTDGSAPTPESALYTGPFPLTKGIRTINAILVKDGRQSVVTRKDVE